MLLSWQFIFVNLNIMYLIFSKLSLRAKSFLHIFWLMIFLVLFVWSLKSCCLFANKKHIRWTRGWGVNIWWWITISHHPPLTIDRKYSLGQLEMVDTCLLTLGVFILVFLFHMKLLFWRPLSYFSYWVQLTTIIIIIIIFIIIRYGVRVTTEECPVAVFVMSVQSIVGVIIQVI